ncbi:polysaccharide pyruvyl transferase family protein [Frigoribacterium faeni]|uniref:GumL protein n=1 Tax=Frigoribacterium faeni TaxID=145483 RepID=A0A7W3JG86_9MICO|nr:polysaccharide pyruvyl transferase family protein [Frigoribacterium faeni]MBA8812286.1 pyruvyl transferase [Frigoribacterium faeni]BFF13332.1 polysaccharide pyruvyl transferase family protein [Microbacterium flavescens]GEK83142.1 GumL protein [Frigoribacterium faeni]
MPDHHTVVRGVRVVRWDPSRPGPAGPRRVGNFGDLLGPLVVRSLLGDVPVAAPSSRRLVAVGSILHLSRPGDVVWGAGVNGKMPLHLRDPAGLDVRSVRGPLTRALLAAHGVDVPSVFGDPGLLVADAVPDLHDAAARSPRRDVTIVPNLNDRAAFRDDPRAIDPTGPVHDVLRAIAESRIVVASSLHGLVVADALGIDARPLVSRSEHPFKYADHYAGTGRPEVRAAADVDAALAGDGTGPAVVDLEALRAAFPADLWTDPPAPRGRDRRMHDPAAETVSDAERARADEVLSAWVGSSGTPSDGGGPSGHDVAATASERGRTRR